MSPPCEPSPATDVAPPTTAADAPLFDCDIHQGGLTKNEWLHYLDEPYRTEVAEAGLRVLSSGIRFEDGGIRWDASADHVSAVRTGLLDAYGTRIGILTGNNGPVAGVPDPDYVAALCRAINNHALEQWTAHEPRLRMGIKIPLQDPALAVREIERLAGHPHVACVLFWGGAERIPFGQRYYWPIYEAAQRHHLPIHVHPSTTTGIAAHATSAAGNLTTYLQTHVCLPQFYQAHLVSLVLEGVFEAFPRLKFLFVEGGFSWLPHVLWRMDKEYKGLRQQAPRLKRLPSDYMRDHVRLCQQPMEEPSSHAHLAQLLDMMGGPGMLCYASDYPHYDFDPPSVIPKSLGDRARRAILHDNAAAFFNL